MLALPRRVLRMELPIVEHLVKKQDYTNYLECGAEAIRAKKNETTVITSSTTSYFCEKLTVNRSLRLAFKNKSNKKVEIIIGHWYFCQDRG